MASLREIAVLYQKVDMRHLGTGAQHMLSTETLCRWTGLVGRSPRSQTTLSHMSPNGLSASLKLTAGTSWWCVRRAPLEHLEQTAVGTETPTADREQRGFSDPPSPRRASIAEPLSGDVDEEKPAPTQPSASGRRAIVDLESYQPSQTVLPAQPAASTVVGQSAAESPQPRRSAPAKPPELVVEPPKITAPEVAPRDPIVVPAQPTISTPAPIPPPARTQQTELYRPAPLTDRPTTKLPPSPGSDSTSAPNEACGAGSGALARSHANNPPSRVWTSRPSRCCTRRTPDQAFPRDCAS